MLPFFTFGNMQIPSFFIVVTLASIFSFWFSYYRSKLFTLDTKLTLDLTLVLFMSSLIGARLFHVFYESPEFYLHDPIRILYVWNGGFVFYGGIISAIPAGLIFLFLLHKQSLIPHYFQLYAPGISCVYIIGRIGCLLTGCCFGSFCILPWAINGRHPTQLYAIFGEIIVLILLLQIEKKYKHLLFLKSNLFFWFLVLHGFNRLIMEYFRNDFRGPIYYYSISQWISLLFVLVGASSIIIRIYSHFSETLKN